MSTDRSADTDPLLDSNCESRTDPLEGDSGSLPPEYQTDDFAEPDDWNRQQKRTFHRIHTLLSYWEQHGYQIRWVTLTSCPESDDADRLAYNHRRLRQTIERAHAARDRHGDLHDLDHIREIESLVVRTAEGPAGKGVLHLFWAWKPPNGHHSLDFFVPHHWLKYQWGRIHGPYDEHAEQPVQPLYVWIEKVGEKDYHSRESLAGYCVSQYLGEHGDALENVSWSWQRTLGGSVTDAWEAVRSITESIEEAIEIWHRILGGERVTLSSPSDHVHYEKAVKPPPNLGVEVVETISVTPPDDYQPPGPYHEVHTEDYTTDETPETDKKAACADCRQWFPEWSLQTVGVNKHDRPIRICPKCLEN